MVAVREKNLKGSLDRAWSDYDPDKYPKLTYKVTDTYLTNDSGNNIRSPLPDLQPSLATISPVVNLHD